MSIDVSPVKHSDSDSAASAKSTAKLQEMCRMGDCEKRFHISCSKIDENQLLELESGVGTAQTVKLTVACAVVWF